MPERDPRFDHHEFLGAVVNEDLRYVVTKDRSYGASWKKRGGVGAFMMMARKWDRLENIMSEVGKFGGGDKDAPKYDVFKWIECEKSYDGRDGTILAEIRDLRRYLLLVEAEMMARGVVQPPRKAKTDSRPVPLEDSNKHAPRNHAFESDEK